jgi:N-acyl homoserine lactone hydrolase
LAVALLLDRAAVLLLLAATRTNKHDAARGRADRGARHTPGHQSLFLKLANTGNVLLSGDLYHYPEEITYKKVPVTDPNREQTAKSREVIEAFVKQNQAQLWIQHDYTAGIKRKIAPTYYD